METYIFVGSLLIFLAILTPILSIFIYKKYIRDADYGVAIIIINLLIIIILLVIGFHCLIKSNLIF